MAPPVRYWEAPEVQEIAERLIPLYHVHLIDQTIRYVFRSRAATRGHQGWCRLGRAYLLAGLHAYLAQPDVEHPELDLFLMEIAADQWGKLQPPQREALVDHELEHMKIEVDDGTGEIEKWIRPHDVEEFDAIVARHGAWKPDLARFAHALEAGADAGPPASDAEIYPADDEVGRVLASAREQEAGLADILRRARGR